MILQLSPDSRKRTYEHERVYILANKKALVSYEKLSKLCKCVQRIYGASTVQIRSIVKRRTDSSSSSEEDEEEGKGTASELSSGSADLPSSLMPGVDEDSDHRSSSSLSPASRSGAFFRTMERRNVTTLINELYILEQREGFTRPVSFLYKP